MLLGAQALAVEVREAQQVGEAAHVAQRVEAGAAAPTRARTASPVSGEKCQAHDLAHVRVEGGGGFEGSHAGSMKKRATCSRGGGAVTSETSHRARAEAAMTKATGVTPQTW